MKLKDYLNGPWCPVPADYLTLDDWESIGELIGDALKRAEIEKAVREKAKLEEQGGREQ